MWYTMLGEWIKQKIQNVFSLFTRTKWTELVFLTEGYIQTAVCSIFSVILCYAHFERSDWLKIFEQPIGEFETRLASLYAGNNLYRIRPGPDVINEFCNLSIGNLHYGEIKHSDWMLLVMWLALTNQCSICYNMFMTSVPGQQQNLVLLSKCLQKIVVILMSLKSI